MRAAIPVIIASIILGVIVGIVGTVDLGKGDTYTIDKDRAIVRLDVKDLQGIIVIDGSSTVFPITEFIAEEFSNIYPDVTVSVGVSGTGGGYKRFVLGEIDINDASREIKKKEIELARENDVRYVQIPIALEGLSIVVNPNNDWIKDDCISIDQLREIWKPDSRIRLWSDINPSYPNKEIRLYGAGPDSGTFDYFTERVVGEARASRIDYIPSEDDNVLVQGIANDRYALGYIPLAYVEQVNDRIKVLSVSDDQECVYPNSQTVTSGKYPLSRPLFITINYDKLKSKEVLRYFVEFYIANAKEAANTVGYVPLPDEYYEQALRVLKDEEYEPNDDTFLKLYERYGGV